jgi:outer membrane protein assembly factor BamB
MNQYRLHLDDPLCTRVEAFLANDRDLKPSERAIVTQHLATCAQCRQRQQEYTAVETGVRQGFPRLSPQPPITLEDIMRSATNPPPSAKAPTRVASTVQPARPSARPRPRGMIAAAAMLALVAIIEVVLHTMFSPGTPNLPSNAGSSVPNNGAPGTIYYEITDPQHPNASGRLYAVHAADRTTQWTWDVPSGQLGAQPYVSDGVVYVITVQSTILGQSTTLYALTADKGKRLWQYDGSFDLSASLAVGDNLVLIPLQDGLVALHADTGHIAWTYHLGALVSTPGLALGNGPEADRVYLNTAAHKLVGVRLSDGAVMLQSPTIDQDLSAPWSAPTVSEGRVFSTWDDATYAIDPVTGAFLWKYLVGANSPDSAGLAASNVVINHMVLVPTQQGVIGLDAQTGHLLWKTSGGRVIPLIASDGGLGYFVTDDDHIHAINSDGHEQWQQAFNGTMRGATFRHGYGYICYSDHTFALLNATTGDTLATYDLGNGVVSTFNAG